LHLRSIWYKTYDFICSGRASNELSIFGISMTEGVGSCVLEPSPLSRCWEPGKSEKSPMCELLEVPCDRSNPDTSFTSESISVLEKDAPPFVCCARFAAAVMGDRLGLGKLTSCAEVVSRGVSREGVKDASSAKGPPGSKSDSAIGGVAATPGPSNTPVGKEGSGVGSRSSERLPLECDERALDSWSRHRGGVWFGPICCDVALGLELCRWLLRSFGSLDEPRPAMSVSGVARCGSSISFDVGREAMRASLSCSNLGFLLWRCVPSSSTAFVIDGGGESSALSRFRRPETERRPW
jgi:hypothetical protein